MMLCIVLWVSTLLCTIPEDYYAILGVDRNATLDQLKKAYREKSKQYHPDKNKDSDAQDWFAAVSNAYQVLSDPQTRHHYNLYGKNGRQFQRQKSASATVPLVISLKDAFLGTTQQMTVTKREICSHCNGSGAFSHKDIDTCPECRGTGTQTRIQQSFFFRQQVQVTCNKCNGLGHRVLKKCPHCHAGYVNVQRTLEVPISRGQEDGSHVVLHGESNQERNKDPGDLVVKVSIKNDVNYRREGCNLYLDHVLTLIEALFGFSTFIEGLDGNILLSRDHITQPGFVDVLHGKGMPCPAGFGDLFVKYSVILPPDIPKFISQLSLHEDL